MTDDLEALLRAAGIPDAGRADGLWAEYRSGGPGADAAFRTLLAWYGLALYRRVWGFVRSDAADDVFQDVLAALHRRRGRLLTWADAHRWLRTTAVRAAVDAYRQETRRKRREARRAVRPDDADPGDGPVQTVLHAELRAALAKLPEADRQVVALLYFEGLTATDAARVLGKNRDTVAAWEARALGRLRKALPAAGVTVGGTAGVEGVLAAGRPFVPAARLGELAKSALTRSLPGPSLGTAAAVLVAGLALGGVGLAGWAAMPAPEPESAQVPPRAEPPVPAAPVREETVPERALRVFYAEVLPRQLAALRPLMPGNGKVELESVDAHDSRVRCTYRLRSRVDGSSEDIFRLHLAHNAAEHRTEVQYIPTDGRNTMEATLRASPRLTRVIAAFDRLPRDRRTLAIWRELLERNERLITPYLGTWYYLGDPAWPCRFSLTGRPLSADRCVNRFWVNGDIRPDRAIDLLQFDSDGRVYNLMSPYGDGWATLSADGQRLEFEWGAWLSREPVAPTK